MLSSNMFEPMRYESSSASRSLQLLADTVRHPFYSREANFSSQLVVYAEQWGAALKLLG
jgi:hypothetical protein